MSLQASFSVALYALTGLLLALLVATSVRKAVRARGERRRRRLEAGVRPALMQYLVEEQDDPAALDVRGRGAEATLRSVAIALLPKLRGADRDALVAVLASRGVLARALRRTRRPGAVGRARAAELLGTARAPGSFAELRRLLNDPEPEVRIVAARALGKLGDPEAVAPLLGALDARRPIPPSVVTMALLHIGPPASGELAAVLRDEGVSPVAHRAAAELLGLFGAVEAVDSLIDALRAGEAGRAGGGVDGGAGGDSGTRAAAARSLGRIGLPVAAGPLAAALGAEEVEVRAAAAQALGELGGEQALPALSTALGDVHVVARQAAHALARQGAGGRQILYGAIAAGGRGAGEAREAVSGLNRRSRARGARGARGAPARRLSTAP